ncbi:hypothetical protein Pelo_10253 [Pelomyxa schiedti]|nr:hypothetical protein Pelo_10253 [Pelomyxa schiedti]
MSGEVTVYTSGTGGVLVQKYTTCMINLVEALLRRKVAVVRLDLDQTKREMVWNNSGLKGKFPLLFVGDTFIGDWETVEALHEENQLAPKLLL